MNKKNVFLAILSILVIALFAANVAAVGLDVEYVKLNDDILDESNGHAINYEVKRGEELDIRVKLTALENVADVVVRADIIGYDYSSYEHDKVSDETRTFDLTMNDTVYKNLNLMIPADHDQDYLKLRIYVADRDGVSYEETYELHVTGIDREDAVVINDYSFSPSQNVQPGRAMTATVRVENLGNYDLDDVKVTVSIPELNVQDSETLDELDENEKETLEEFLIRIPTNAQPGEYTVKIDVKFDKYESTSVTDTIIVSCLEGSSTCGGVVAEEETQNSLINVPSNMPITTSGASFPITIENRGSADLVYSLSVNGVNWGQFSFDPSSDVIVSAGTSKTVYLHVIEDKLEAGDKYFELQVVSGNKITKAALSVTATEGSSSNGLRSALEIGLIVLVVILIIIGLIIGFSKLKDNSKEDDESETYY